MRALRVALFMLFAAPAAAQTRVGSVHESPFSPGTSRIYDTSGDLVGTARENAFRPGETDLYDAEGKPTGIEVRDNAFDPTRSDVLDTHAPDSEDH